MSSATLPIAGASGIPNAAARVQQLQALIAQVERGPVGASTKATEASGYASPTTKATEASGYASPTSKATATSGSTGSTFATALDAAQANQHGTGSAYVPMINQAAARYGLNPSILYGLIQQESGFDPSARSGAGALGLTQLMPSTAASLGVVEPLDPAQSIEGGARYLSQLLHQFAGNTADALAAYNAGPGAVQQYGGVPPYSETQQYVTKVLGNATAYSQGNPEAATTAIAGGRGGEPIITASGAIS